MQLILYKLHTHYYKVNILGTVYSIGDGGSGTSNADTSNTDLASEVALVLRNSASTSNLNQGEYATATTDVTHNGGTISVSNSGAVVTLTPSVAGVDSAFDVNAYDTASPIE